MELIDIKQLLASDRYSFLRENEHLGGKIILLGLGGSYSYGTNVEGSDIDIRGIALNSTREILTGNYYEQFTNTETDTVIYGFKKIMQMLANSNPNVIELLGLRPEHYLCVGPIGQQILNNKDMFLSQKCINSFRGFCKAQMHDVKKAFGDVSPEDAAARMVDTLTAMSYKFVEKYNLPSEKAVIFHMQKDEMTGEYTLLVDIDGLRDYPFDDWSGFMSEFQTTVKQLRDINKRVKYSMTHERLSKLMMHAVRPYAMCIELLETGNVVTYREKEHDLLMDIRNGKWQYEDGRPIPEFYEMLDDYETKLDYAAANTVLPEEPDNKRIDEFVMQVMNDVVCGNI